LSPPDILRRLAGPPARLALRGFAGVRTRSWAPASRLFVVGEGSGWSVDEDATNVEAAARRLGWEVAPAGWARFGGGQAVFLTSHFEALTPRWLDSSHHIGVAYMHGRPGTPGMPEFDSAFDALRERSDRIARIQVTHREMHDLMLEAGVDPARIFRIPLGIDLEWFPLGDAERRRRAREALGLPVSAFVAGSFQKDGVGWDEGLEPKLIKGPDVLVAALDRLRRLAPELVVLLTGPARGYVRRELERLGIPYRHVQARSRNDLAKAYHALDVYLVASRQEGGPKAAFEAMAAGVPFVTTRVGQAQELVQHGRTGLLVEVEDDEGLAGSAAQVREDADLVALLRAAGRSLAEAHALEMLDPRWGALLEGFVAKVGGGRAH
jgi:glycosyltransferase involved in cell wall biosynthesis